ncbi:amidase [Propionicicella superfundia]|uniref:amidase n=1 Tax=Propionicicella superfundia TaxID=348582 RepID=UPI0003FC1C82|nr:amidase [Propionicicella superfundia]
MPAITDLTVTELTQAYATGNLSPVEATRAHLEAAHRLQPVVNAFSLIDEAAALAQAGASERRWREGAPIGTLDGVPITLKDAFLTSGWPMRKGSTLTDPHGAAAEDAPCVALARAAGAVFLGKTTTPEFSWKGVTDSALTGVSGNPWDPGRTCGGSSGGAAAATAARVGRVAIGSDGGGSVRIPASFCGVVGFKPTSGRVPIYPPSSFGPVGHVGPLATTVAEAAIAMDVLARFDPRDPDGDPARQPHFAADLHADVSGLRIAYCPSFAGDRIPVQPDVARAVEAAVTRLDDLGADVDLVPPPFPDPIDAFSVLWGCGSARLLEKYSAEQLGAVDPGLLACAAEGAARTGVECFSAIVTRTDVGRAMTLLHTRYDLLVTPTLPLTAFAAGVDVPPGSGMTRWLEWTPYTYPFNLTGQPAVTIPCGRDAQGLPIGVQLVGRRFADELVLAAARALEEALDLDMTPPV